MAHARTKTGDGDAPDLSHFRRRYPLTVANFGALPDREAWLRRVWEAETRERDAFDTGAREAIVRGAPPARLSVEGEFEIVYTGGAHALLHAAVMAHVHKRRVVVFDARDAERTERGWNVSNEELEGLARTGLFSTEEIESAVVNRYRAGLVKFHDAGSRVKAPPLEVRDVLDVAIDADRLLAAAAAKLSASEGCATVEGARFVRAYVEPHRVSVEVEDKRGARRLFAARLFVDAGGAGSAVARQLREGRAPTHVSPTVGSVARGFARGRGAGTVDFGVGEIMVTTEDASAHRQLLWGGFAGDARRDEFTSCLFFYDAADSPADKSLLALFEQYFEKLPAYKRAGAHWRVVRPVFGYGHGAQRHGWKAHGRGAMDRVMLACGEAGRANLFALSDPGARLRDLRRSTHLTNLALAADLLDARALSEISPDEPRAAHASHLAEFLRPHARAQAEPATVNETLNAVMAALHDLDDRVRRELFQDRLSLGALRSLLSRTVRLYPRILQRIASHLGARGTFLWLAHATEAAIKERHAAHAAQNSPGDDGAGAAEAAREFARHIELYRKERGGD
ncbi:MAG: lycopene cyclase CruA [Acidobacteriota bacterium]|nr:lycopene cyclase CruA [Acidobacteriota bacterium]